MITEIVNRLRSQQHRDSTHRTYYTVWWKFNEFIIKLDVKPANWESKIVLFVGYMVDKQSSTIKSYISAIRSVLTEVNVQVSENNSLITALTKACRLINDKVRARLLIQKELLQLILKQILRMFKETGQVYLMYLYATLIATAYYGLFRVGELTTSPHVVLAKNMHIGQNKHKLLLILETSKTHTVGDKPQMIKITSKPDDRLKTKVKQNENHNICPYLLLKQYLALRRPATTDDEPFFIFNDGNGVSTSQFRTILKLALKGL